MNSKANTEINVLVLEAFELAGMKIENIYGNPYITYTWMQQLICSVQSHNVIMITLTAATIRLIIIAVIVTVCRMHAWVGWLGCGGKIMPHYLERLLGFLFLFFGEFLSVVTLMNDRQWSSLKTYPEY